MSKAALSLKVGEDKTFPFTAINESDGQPRDLTGAYIYVQVTRADGTTVVFLKDNDPAGANTGITIDPDQVANTGQWEFDAVRADTVAETPEDECTIEIWIDFDPLAAGDHKPTFEGIFRLKASQITIP